DVSRVPDEVVGIDEAIDRPPADPRSPPAAPRSWRGAEDHRGILEDRFARALVARQRMMEDETEDPVVGYASGHEVAVPPALLVERSAPPDLALVLRVVLAIVAAELRHLAAAHEQPRVARAEESR